jgi:cyanophycin synthetase
VRLIEIRMLEGPNVYRLEPAVKVEVVVGRRRTWYGERSPGRHAVVELGAPVRPDDAPSSVRALAAWVARLHRLAHASAWLVAERGPRARLGVAIHRTSEPGHWIVAYPWRERERAELIADVALRLVDRGSDPETTTARSRTGGGRALRRGLELIAAAGTTPPPWIRDAERRMPTVSISGTNGKSTTTRMITHILTVSGRRTGTTTSDGVLIDEVLTEEGDLTGPMGAQAVLRDASLDVAVLETARGGIVLKGIGYESNEVSVLTNVSADHLDLQGIHTLPEMAEVKSVVARITKPEGTAVLNAEDPLVAALARRVRANVCFFSLSPSDRRVRRHVAAGGTAVVLDRDGWMVEQCGRETTRFVRVIDVPATVLGLARHNVANALAAAGAARALGVTLDDVAAGLRDFRPSAAQAPGRLNLYRVGERLVIVDFAHNEAGLSVVLDVAEGLVGRRGRRRAPLTAIVGTAGDRPDDTLRGLGRIAAERADEVAIKETLRYLRGRSRASAIGEIMAGIEAGGGRREAIPVYEDEPTALREELTSPVRAAGGGSGVVLLLCHSDRAGVERVILELGGTPASDLDWFAPAATR